MLVTKQEMIEVQKAEAQGAQDVHALEVQRFETRLLVRRVYTSYYYSNGHERTCTSSLLRACVVLNF